jgi:CheY-like chemotaxis protein
VHSGHPNTSTSPIRDQTALSSEPMGAKQSRGKDGIGTLLNGAKRDPDLLVSGDGVVTEVHHTAAWNEVFADSLPDADHIVGCPLSDVLGHEDTTIFYNLRRACKGEPFTLRWSFECSSNALIQAAMNGGGIGAKYAATRCPVVLDLVLLSSQAIQDGCCAVPSHQLWFIPGHLASSETKLNPKHAIGRGALSSCVKCHNVSADNGLAWGSPDDVFVKAAGDGMRFFHRTCCTTCIQCIRSSAGTSVGNRSPNSLGSFSVSSGGSDALDRGRRRSPITVAIVDPSEANRKDIAKALQEFGMTPAWSLASPKELLGLYQRTNEGQTPLSTPPPTIDVLVVNAVLPGVTLAEFMSQLAKHAVSHTPAVVACGTNECFSDSALAAGASFFVRIPPNKMDILIAITTAANQRRQQTTCM